MNYFLYQDDIPSNIKFGDIVAIDTETIGLYLQWDRLCLIQLSNGDCNSHLIQISKLSKPIKSNFDLVLINSKHSLATSTLSSRLSKASNSFFIL